MNKTTVVEMSVIAELFSNKSKYQHSEATGHRGIPDEWHDGMQSEYNERFIYYRHPQMPENYFMKETYQTDSYGSEERITNVEFVKGVEKQVTVFEPIN